MPYNQKQLDEIEAQGGFDEDEDIISVVIDTSKNISKYDVMRAFAESAGIPIVDVKLSNYDPQDYQGLPTFGDHK